MHSTSIRCIWWSIILFVVGTLSLEWAGHLVFWVSEWLGPNGLLGAYSVSFAVTLVRSVVFPVGAALIGAVVVIETLRVRNAATAPGEGDLETE